MLSHILKSREPFFALPGVGRAKGIASGVRGCSQFLWQPSLVCFHVYISRGVASGWHAVQSLLILSHANGFPHIQVRGDAIAGLLQLSDLCVGAVVAHSSLTSEAAVSAGLLDLPPVMDA